MGDTGSIGQRATQIAAMEAEGIDQAVSSVAPQLPAAVDVLKATRGKVILIGVGKSGLICQKIAATLSSTGTPSVFLHPTEALHGDLGVVATGDAVIVISNSGSSPEIATLLPALRAKDVPIVGITGYEQSILARSADVVLCTGILEEACPLGLAPTTSTTAALVIGDVLAVLLMEASGFGQHDFARSHPGGALGRSLLSVRENMRTLSDDSMIAPETEFLAVVEAVGQSQAGASAVVDDDGILVGVVTDGDLRRAMAQGPECFSATARDIMGHRPKTIAADASLQKAARLMEQLRVSVLFVVQQHQPVGLLHIHDIIDSSGEG